jgi:hypothetical protein
VVIASHISLIMLATLPRRSGTVLEPRDEKKAMRARASAELLDFEI